MFFFGAFEILFLLARFPDGRVVLISEAGFWAKAEVLIQSELFRELRDWQSVNWLFQGIR